MTYIAALLVGVLGGLFASEAFGGKTLDIVGGPDYTVMRVKPKSGLEVRQYNHSTWVTTSPYCGDPEDTVGSNYGYFSLYFYINKRNSKLLSYKMEQPFLKKYTVNSEGNCTLEFQQMFFLSSPAAIHPKPFKGYGLSLFNLTTQKIYAMPYQRNLDSNKTEGEECADAKLILDSEIKRNKKWKVDPDVYFCARYDRIQRYEVWVGYTKVEVQATAEKVSTDESKGKIKSNIVMDGKGSKKT